MIEGLLGELAPEVEAIVAGVVAELAPLSSTRQS